MEYKIGNEARCAVIGYGSWATAIVGLLTANETRVGWYVPVSYTHLTLPTT